MRGVYAKVLTAGLFVLAASPAFAQPPGRPGGGFGQQVPSVERLLSNDKVQEELKLTDDQKAAVKKATETVNAKYKDDLDKARADRDFAKMTELRKAQSADLEKALVDAIKPEQLKRVKQIQVQAAGLNAFSMEDVETALKLSDKQKDDIKDEAKGLQDDIRDINQAAGTDPDKRAEVSKKIQTLRTESIAKIVDGLSADQKKTWKDLTGDKFEVALGNGGGFGPGGPGGGGPGGFGPGGRGGRGLGGAALLQLAQVQKELNITDDQKSDAQKASDKVREKYKDEMDKARQDMDMQKTAELFKAQNEDQNKAIAGILKPEQFKRFKQIEVQVGGIGAFAMDDVQTALKLTDAQKKDVKDATDAMQKDMRETFQNAFQGGFDADKMTEAMKKVQSMQADAIGKVVAGLTDDQKKTWKELTGEKFDLDLSALRRPGGPGGRPNPNP